MGAGEYGGWWWSTVDDTEEMLQAESGLGMATKTVQTFAPAAETLGMGGATGMSRPEAGLCGVCLFCDGLGNESKHCCVR